MQALGRRTTPIVRVALFAGVAIILSACDFAAGDTLEPAALDEQQAAGASVGEPELDEPSIPAAGDRQVEDVEVDDAADVADSGDPVVPDNAPALDAAGTADDNSTASAREVDADVIVEPGMDVARVIERAPRGSVVLFREGMYRGAQIEPKPGMTFVSDGAVLRGSVRVSGFARSGGTWVADADVSPVRGIAQGDEWGRCDFGEEACIYPEQLFIDGELQRRVRSASSVGAGRWFFDTSRRRVMTGSDPSGRTVELSTTRYAFHGSADDITIDGFVIEHYATPGRQGAINPRVGRIGAAGERWTVVGNVVRSNHGWGVKMEDGMRIAGNTISSNGQGGIGGVADAVTIERNTISDNCVAGFKCFGWEGGALKLHGDDLTIRDNVVSDNHGHGIHTDIGCDRARIVNNVVTGNEGAGVHHEISGSATIKGNVLKRNGFRSDGHSEPGLLIINSSDVTVEDNDFASNAKQIVMRQDRRTDQGILRSVTVRGNTIRINEPSSVVLNRSTSTAVPGWGTDIAFDDNRYELSVAGTAKPFVWRGSAMTVDQWRRTGNDRVSEFVETP